MVAFAMLVSMGFMVDSIMFEYFNSCVVGYLYTRFFLGDNKKERKSPNEVLASETESY